VWEAVKKADVEEKGDPKAIVLKKETKVPNTDTTKTDQITLPEGTKVLKINGEAITDMAAWENFKEKDGITSINVEEPGILLQFRRMRLNRITRPNPRRPFRRLTSHIAMRISYSPRHPPPRHRGK